MNNPDSVERFELPFQWDDGEYISPFVRSRESVLTSLAEWIIENHIWPIVAQHLFVNQTDTFANKPIMTEHSTIPFQPFFNTLIVKEKEQEELLYEEEPFEYRSEMHCRYELEQRYENSSQTENKHSFTVHFSIIDIGCGDGSALFTLTKCLIFYLNNKLNEFNLSHNVVVFALHVIGIDLNDKLIHTANNTAVKFAHTLFRFNKADNINNNVNINCYKNEQGASSLFISSHESNNIELRVEFWFKCADARTLPSPSKLCEDVLQRGHCTCVSKSNVPSAKCKCINAMCRNYINTIDIVVPTLIFLYLLPDALQVLEHYILECLLDKDEKCLIASNSWPVSYLQH